MISYHRFLSYRLRKAKKPHSDECGFTWQGLFRNNELTACSLVCDLNQKLVG